MKTNRKRIPRKAAKTAQANESRKRGGHRSLLPSLVAVPLLLAALAPLPAGAAKLEASNGVPGDDFGFSVSRSGGSGIVGAYASDNFNGAAYLFRNLNTATGTITETARLTASDGRVGGYSVSLTGSNGLVGSYGAKIGANIAQGATYLFRNLDTVTGTVTETAKLTASDGASEDHLGYSVSLSGNSGLAGADGASVGGNPDQGAAYLFRNLDTATGTITESARLTASDGGAFSRFGLAVSLSGSGGLVTSNGAAYLFRNLDTAAGTITQSAKLTTSDGGAAYIGENVNLAGNSGLIGTIGIGSNQGAAYLFRDLDAATGTITETARLTALGGAANDYFGASVSQSGSVGLVGAYGNDGFRGAAYLFRNLDTATGTVTESVKLTASDGAPTDDFGGAVSLDGDQFLIGAVFGNGGVPSGAGSAYTGSVSSVTTLDAGGTSRIIDGISFTSRTDWIVGQTIDGNQVILTAGDAASVTAAGKAVYIGQGAGSDANILRIAGSLTANEIHIGSLAGNTGNTLQLDATATFSAIALRLAPGNLFAIEGDHTGAANLLAYLGATDMQVWDGSAWETVDGANYTTLISESFASGYTSIAAVPEPAVIALLLLGVLLVGGHTGHTRDRVSKLRLQHQ